MILGGKYQGKRTYAEKLYGKFPEVSDLAEECTITPGLVVNVHLGIKRGLRCKYFAERISVLKRCVIICTEVGGGVVPVEKDTRTWRDEAGRVYQYLAGEAEIVDRIFAGLALRLKG